MKTSAPTSRPVSVRVRHIFFWTYALSVLLVLAVAWWFLEDLESTSLEMDKQAEIEHFLSRQETDTPVKIQSANLTLVYHPASIKQPEELPIVFQGLPVPYEGEISFLDSEYLIIIHQLPQGTFYLAKNLALFEHRETIMVLVLLSLAVLVLFLGYALSLTASRQIAAPLRQLAGSIRELPAGERGSRLPSDYADTELNDIARAMNHYLDDIDRLIERERSLITMASHELRTPISVILGATEILARRNRLEKDDQKTLQRIIASAETMSSNVQALLTLVRQSKEKELQTECDLGELLDALIRRMREDGEAGAERLNWQNPGETIQITADPSMVRILLHNLISNALNHNRGQVWVSLDQRFIEVRDQAVAAPASVSTLTAGELTDTTSGAGLGLYIVTLICDFLGWRFSMTSRDGQETRVQVDMRPD